MAKHLQPKNEPKINLSGGTAMQRNEKTVNDSYLIVKDKEIIKISYRKNLKKALIDLNADAFAEIENLDAKKIDDLRKIVLAADREGYEIYQLTRL